MESISLLFDNQSRHLGEMVTRGGALVQVRLNHVGENLIGVKVVEWQTRGVPVIRIDHERMGRGEERVLKEDRIMANSAGFFSAVQSWLTFQKFHVMTLEADTLECWERMLHLPLSAEERFAMIYAVCRLPSADMRAWMKALDDAAKAVARV